MNAFLDSAVSYLGMRKEPRHTRELPPTHAIDVLRIAFLSGGSVERSVLSLAVIAGWTLVVFVAALQTVAHRGTTVKRLPREQPAKGQPVRSREKEAAA